MNKSFRIGFPVVAGDTKKAYPMLTRLDFRDGEPGLKVFMNDGKEAIPLAESYPFDEDNGRVTTVQNLFSGFAQALKEGGKAKTLTFRSGNGHHPALKGGKLVMDPRSAATCLALLPAVRQCRDKGDMTALISACLENNAPRALRDPGMVRIKARLCREDDHTLLFLHCDDWEGLRTCSKSDSAEASEFKSLMGRDADVKNQDAFEKALEEGRRIFPLPVHEGMWDVPDTGNKTWRMGLCDLLGLEHESEPSPVEDEEPVKESRDGSFLPEPEEGSPLDLFLRAVEGDDYLPDDLREAARAAIRDNPSAARSITTALPPESLAHSSHKWNEEERFWLSRGNRERLMPNIIVCGPTGSGKTLLAQALLINVLTEHRKALYIGPTRALVEEVHAKIRRALPGERYRVVLSTGEQCQDDWRFKRSAFDIACVVNEKANVILPMNPSMMKSLAVVVVDEIHMLSSRQRGGPLDMLLAKIRQEQERGGSDCRLRIAALTTELSSTEQDQLSAYLTRSSDEEEIRPVVVAPPARPQKVRHSLVLYTCGAMGTQKSLTLSEFSSQEDRQIGPEKALALRKEIEGLYRSFPASSHSSRSENEYSGRTADLLNEYAAKARRFLVVVNSKKQIETLAALLVERRKGSAPFKGGPNAKTAEAIGKICKVSCLADGLAGELEEQAAYGVYRHHGDIPQDLRQVVEGLFRSDDKPEGERTPILLCTETLSYGVNLRADRLALLSLKFPRQDDSEDGREELTPTEYHNILGRVGRFRSEDDSVPEAMIMLTPDENCSDTLSGYYEKMDALRSTAIDDGDLRKCCLGKLKGRDLDSISFPSFRTVMDALRMAQSSEEGGDSRYVSATEVNGILEDTFYCKQKERKELDKFVVWVLDGASEATSSMDLPEDLSIVRRVQEKRDARYHLEPQGAALIDTGTHWKYLKHMQRWLEKLKRLGNGDAAPIGKMPAELFLPAFIANRDVFDQMIRPLMENYKKGRERPDEWLDELEKALRDRLGNLLGGEMKDLIDPYMAALAEFADDNLKDWKVWECFRFPDPQKKHLFFCVLLISLYWLDGEHEKMLELTRNPCVRRSRQQNISERRFDRMSWSVQMCRSFFRDIQPVKGHIAELSNLVLRLRKGVPEKGLPFAYGGQLTALQIRQLLRNNITPLAVLRDREYPGTFDGRGLKLPAWKDLVGQVKVFYRKECDKLQSELSGSSDDSLGKFLEDYCFRNIRNGDVAVEQFVKLGKWENFLTGDDGHTAQWLEIPRGEEEGQVFRIRLLTCPPNPDDAGGMVFDGVCDLSFRKPEGGGRVVFTPCALYVLGMKLDRDRTDWGDFFEELSPEHVVDVPTVLGYTDSVSELAAVMEVPLSEA